MRKLVIPSAKVVPQEMQNLGKIPAILYPVNAEIVLDYMLRQYEHIVQDISIVAYEKKEMIKQTIDNYRKGKVNVVELDELRDLGYTIYYGLIKEAGNYGEDSQVIINFADTIVMDNIYDITGDCFYYTEDYVNEKWTYFDESQGCINHIIDKKQTKNFADKMAKLFIGVFQIAHPLDFIKCLEKAFAQKNDMDSFYAALMEYSNIHPMQALKTDNWFDIGHADKYYNSRLAVRARAFNHITIDKERGILKKVSDERDKFIGEIMWYLKLPSDIEYARPRIFSYSTSYDNLYVNMEYYAYHTVHELYLYGDLTYNNWVDIFKRIRFIFKDFSRYRLADKKENIVNSLEEMYLLKTLNRLNSLKEDPRFFPFFYSSFKVNGIYYKPLGEICSVLEEIIPRELYDINEFCIIHGDLCFSNILVDNNFSFIKVVDPRGSFGKYDIYGDPRYDLAKLFHSVDGKYDFIIKDMITLAVNTEPELSIDLLIHDKARNYDFYECFLKCFREEIGNQQKEIELIEALLFLSMIPLHKESVEHQYAMLATGISILDKCADIRLGYDRKTNCKMVNNNVL